MRTGLSPESALRPERSDATALWAVWCLRRAALPLLWVGLIGAALGGEVDSITPEQLQDPAAFLGALVSPLAGVVIALAVRLLANLLALAAAYPLAHGAARHRDGRGGPVARRVRVWIDRFYLTRSLREWRWTWAVRDLAAERLGATGRAWRLWGQGLAVANPVLFVTAVMVIASTTG